MFPTMFLCESMTPLGTPVVPEENGSTQMSSAGLISDSGRRVSSPRESSSSSTDGQSEVFSVPVLFSKEEIFVVGRNICCALYILYLPR